MIATTVQAVLDDSAPYEEDHRVYRVRDNEVIFYVGISWSPWDRLIEHVIHSDRIGDLIKDNRPFSNMWQFDMYTLVDCVPLIKEYKPDMLAYYEPHLGDKRWERMLMEQAERILIKGMMPCLNVRDARGYKHILPERYNKHKIANEGMV